ASAVRLNSNTTYDFTTAANKAYGNNMIHIGTIWAIYTGDLNQDEFIDSNDYSWFDADNFNGVSGVYTGTDRNGDGFVDANDFPLFDINNLNGIHSIHP